MLVSLKWLSDYVPLTLPAKELAERLTHLPASRWSASSREAMTGTASASAQVLDVQSAPQRRPPPPGHGRRRRRTTRPTVVCGAPNVAVGPEGRLRAGRHAAARRPHAARWTVAEGGEDPRRRVGGHGAAPRRSWASRRATKASSSCRKTRRSATPLRDYYGDTIFELEVTPNRPDHMSMLGVAWEVAAQTHVKVREPERVYARRAATSATRSARR